MKKPAIKHACPRYGSAIFAPSECEACDRIEELEAAIREHRDDEEGRWKAYVPGDRKSVADERLWAYVEDET